MNLFKRSKIDKAIAIEPQKPSLLYRFFQRVRPKPIVWSKRAIGYIRRKKVLSKLRPRPIVWLKALFRQIGRLRTKVSQSIKRRLPLSYAAIALITAFSLGMVLISSLNFYFDQREQAYVEYNARLISDNIQESFQTAGLTEELKTRLTNFALLTQTRIRLYDAQGLAVADTGPWPLLYHNLVTRQPLTADYLLQPPDPAVITEDSPSATEQTQILLEEAIATAETAVIEAQDQLENARINAFDAADAVELSNQAVQQSPNATNIAAQLAASEAALIAQSQVSEAEIALAQATANVQEAQLIAQLTQTIATANDATNPWFHGPPTTQSHEHIYLSLYNPNDGQPFGALELSGGPSYRNGIMDGVVGAWFLSSAFAIFLAAVIGWRMSRRITQPVLTLTEATASMAKGELATRVDVQREDELGILGESFNTMASRVENMVDTLSRFVADAAHELNTPLTALRNSLDLAAAEENVEAKQALLKHGRSQVQRLEGLTKGLLNLSRLESETQLYEQTTFDLNGMLLKASEQFASEAEQAGLTFQFNLPREPIFVTGDKVQLHQAISNLIDNAIKFTPANGTVKIALETDDEWITLAVSDTGIGIPDGDLPHLFSRFHRGRNAAAYAGSGLGLAIVKAVAKAHGGTVAASNKNDGALIQLCLPTNSQPIPI